jgi:hypothetical protein
VTPVHRLNTGLVRMGVLLLDELLDECEPLADVLGLGLDFGYRELGLDVHLLELQGVLVVDHLALLLNQQPLELTLHLGHSGALLL